MKAECYRRVIKEISQTEVFPRSIITRVEH